MIKFTDRVHGSQIIPNNVFLDVELNDAIRFTLEKISAYASSKNLRIRNQHLYVSIVPVRQLKCGSGSNEFSVLVYGHNKDVICDDFPIRFSCLKQLLFRRK